jgi:predicted RNase H-like HicB family nuclease
LSLLYLVGFPKVDTFDEALKNIKEAITLYLEVIKK